jgi:hypothetical protein
MSRMKKAVIADVVIVDSVMGLRGWMVEGGKNQRVGQLLTDQSGWGLATMGKTLALQVSWGFCFFTRGLVNDCCAFCIYICVY